MQCHTAEHILSGAIKKLYGLDNVGFHLGDVAVTMDVNGYLTREQLDEVELIANRAVFDNVPVNTFFPDREALATLNYRSKLELVDNVRIVEIEGYDMCACCAPHVARTGEIGMIKILDYERHRGGIRINIAAGYRALRDYKIKYLNAQRISAVFSSPQDVIADAAENFYKEAECLKSELKRAKVTGARLNAMLIKKTEGSYVFYNSEYTVDELREVVNTAKSSVGGIIIALSGNEGNYKLVMSAESVELSTIYKKILSDLGGKGGGRDNMIQGSVTASLDEIKAYFENFKQ
jgi:alanyl-tRNA synthetase